MAEICATQDMCRASGARGDRLFTEPNASAIGLIFGSAVLRFCASGAGLWAS